METLLLCHRHFATSMDLFEAIREKFFLSYEVYCAITYEKLKIDATNEILFESPLAAATEAAKTKNKDDTTTTATTTTTTIVNSQNTESPPEADHNGNKNDNQSSNTGHSDEKKNENEITFSQVGTPKSKSNTQFTNTNFTHTKTNSTSGHDPISSVSPPQSGTPAVVVRLPSETRTVASVVIPERNVPTVNENENTDEKKPKDNNDNNNDNNNNIDSQAQQQEQEQEQKIHEPPSKEEWIQTIKIPMQRKCMKLLMRWIELYWSVDFANQENKSEKKDKDNDDKKKKDDDKKEKSDNKKNNSNNKNNNNDNNNNNNKDKDDKVTTEKKHAYTKLPQGTPTGASTATGQQSGPQQPLKIEVIAPTDDNKKNVDENNEKKDEESPISPNTAVLVPKHSNTADSRQGNASPNDDDDDDAKNVIGDASNESNTITIEEKKKAAQEKFAAKMAIQNDSELILALHSFVKEIKQLREDYCNENNLNQNNRTATYYDYINQIYDVDDIKEDIARIRSNLKTKKSQMSVKMKSATSHAKLKLKQYSHSIQHSRSTTMNDDNKNTIEEEVPTPTTTVGNNLSVAGIPGIGSTPTSGAQLTTIPDNTDVSNNGDGKEFSVDSSLEKNENGNVFPKNTMSSVNDSDHDHIEEIKPDSGIGNNSLQVKVKEYGGDNDESKEYSAEIEAKYDGDIEDDKEKENEHENENENENENEEEKEKSNTTHYPSFLQSYIFELQNIIAQQQLWFVEIIDKINSLENEKRILKRKKREAKKLRQKYGRKRNPKASMNVIDSDNEEFYAKSGSLDVKKNNKEKHYNHFSANNMFDLDFSEESSSDLSSSSGSDIGINHTNWITQNRQATHREDKLDPNKKSSIGGGNYSVNNLSLKRKSSSFDRDKDNNSHFITRERDNAMSVSYSARDWNYYNNNDRNSDRSNSTGESLFFIKIKNRENARRYARQLTLKDFDIFQTIHIRQFLSKIINKKNKNEYSDLSLLIDRFQQCHQYVVVSIIGATSLKHRVEMIDFFIYVAEHLLKLNNLYSFMAVCTGIDSISVQKCKIAWEFVNNKRKFEKILRPLCSGSKNFGKLRQHTNKMKPPGIPFLGIILKDLTYMNDGAVNKLKKDFDSQINFTKFYRFYEICYDGIMVLQNGNYFNNKDNNFNLQIDKNLQREIIRDMNLYLLLNKHTIRMFTLEAQRMDKSEVEAYRKHLKHELDKTLDSGSEYSKSRAIVHSHKRDGSMSKSKSVSKSDFESDTSDYDSDAHYNSKKRKSSSKKSTSLFGFKFGKSKNKKRTITEDNTLETLKEIPSPPT